MLNKVGLICSSWILTSDEQCIDRDLVVLNLHFVQWQAPRILKLCQFETIHMAYRAINMDSGWIGACYVHKSMPLELSGRQYILERLETSSVYIPTHKTYVQVVRTLWLSWVVRLNRNGDILSSILGGGNLEKVLFWPLLNPCTRVGAWASFMDSENIREPLVPGRINLEHCSNPHIFFNPTERK